MLLQIKEQHIEPDIEMVEISGRLALGRESQRVETMVEELAGKGVLKVILNVTGVEYTDSAGIGLLALASGKMKAVGGKLIVVTGPGKVLDMLEMTQMTRVVTVAGSIADATATLGGASASA